MDNPISNTVTDSRDLIEYKEELEQEILYAYIDWAKEHNEYNEAEPLEIPESYEEIEFLDEEAFIQTCEELILEHQDVTDFCNELEDYSGDFHYGAAIIHENHFEEYCEEFIKDCGYIDDNIPRIIENNIDYKGIADDMEFDYTRVEFQGDEYLIR